MVQVQFGLLVECDSTIKELIIKIDESRELGESFIMADLDENHLFITPEVIQALQDKLGEFADSLHFVDDQKDWKHEFSAMFCCYVRASPVYIAY